MVAGRIDSLYQYCDSLGKSYEQRLQAQHFISKRFSMFHCIALCTRADQLTDKDGILVAIDKSVFCVL